ncbi:pyrroline-5-carboxylate reductase family protein [Qipengyuania sediminis]|uniref:pyrroline-5-carboxylate reductase family protein n=1 Tax=Qipengyuania sediminis TaxID=1532023 RepID=UPI001F112F58|nr:pyrroline-5-carboxylate reductase [Qipengyuania sediminis]
MFERILLIGYGTMASAMLEGWLASGLEPERFAVYNPRPKPVPHGVAFTTTLHGGSFDAVVLAVKPQVLEEVVRDAEPLAGPRTTVISVLAGIDLATLAAGFPRAEGIVRLMPNLAVAIGKSPNLLIARGLDAWKRAALTELADRLGSAEWIEEESQFDIVTALTGCGPGFVYRFTDVLARSATEMGIEAALADRLAKHMVAGAGALAVSSPLSPQMLARRVASPGGMTQAGFDVLDEREALRTLMERCLAAAIARGRELSPTAG